MGVKSSARFTMTPIRDLSGALAPFLSARDPDCLARENETAAASGAQTRGRAMPKNNDGGSEKLLTKGEVAQLCRVEVRTVDRWLIAGKIGCYRTPSGRVLFRRNDVLTAIDRKVSSAASAGPPMATIKARCIMASTFFGSLLSTA
jgi:excisionase family DNA binding protein